MKVLLGDTRSRENLNILESRRWGRMFVTADPTPMHCEPWGFDNGAFVAFRRGEAFSASVFHRRLDRALSVASEPWIAIAPDIVAGGLRSLEFSVEYKRKLPIHWPWYLAVQDGMTPDDVRPVIHLFAGVFLGGSDRFKLQAWTWKQFANSEHKPFHYARAGALRKLRHAHAIGADSLDSAFPLWSKERMRLFCNFFDGLGTQRELCDAWR